MPKLIPNTGTSVDPVLAQALEDRPVAAEDQAQVQLVVVAPADDAGRRLPVLGQLLRSATGATPARSAAATTSRRASPVCSGCVG